MEAADKSRELEVIPANRKLVELLYGQAQISKAARDYALDYLYPRQFLGLWASRLLLALGVSLVLAGIIYFFAFNWARIDPIAKLMAIQAGIVGCLIGAYCYSLSSLIGHTLLLSASVLIGVFLAVFGQIYQTGADTYQLFAAWSLLVLGWTLIANSAVHWLLWLVISNIALWLWWQQAALPSWEAKHLIYSYMAIGNSIALALREYFTGRSSYEWLQSRWLRLMLVISILAFMLIPAVALILSFAEVTWSLWLSSTIGIVGHCVLYYTYRYQLPDIWALAATVLSACIILEFLAFDMLLFGGAVAWLLLAFITLALFTAALVHLRQVTKQMVVLSG